MRDQVDLQRGVGVLAEDLPLQVARVVVDGVEVDPGTRFPPSELSATYDDNELLWSFDGERLDLEVAP